MADGTVRIELLQVHFDVVGEGEQEFAKLFERYINRWSRLQNDRDMRDRRACEQRHPSTNDVCDVREGDREQRRGGEREIRGEPHGIKRFQTRKPKTNPGAPV